MTKNTRLVKHLMVCLGLIILFSLSGVTSYAEEVRSVETEGSISFTGSYPVDQPKPPPPTGPGPQPDLNAKPPSSGSRPVRLPQTNDAVQIGLILTGAGMLFLAFWLKRRRDTQEDSSNDD